MTDDKPPADSVSFQMVYFGDQWDARWRRRQQIAHRLAKFRGVEVIYVEFPLSLASLLKYLFGRADGEASSRWRRVFKSGLCSVFDGVRVITPLSLLPSFRPSLLSSLDSRLLQAVTEVLVKKHLNRRAGSRRVLWVSHPFATEYIGRFGEDTFCYDCTEKFSEMKNWDQSLERKVAQRDALITGKADLVFVQTREYLSQKRRVNPNTFYSPNAVDYPLFTSATDTRVVPDLDGIKKPILGTVGSIDYRIDFDLVSKLARDYPEWSFVFVGPKPGAKLAAPLRGLTNVHFLGEKPYQEIPRYLKGFDICLIPYAKTDHQNSPIKLFDYLASGRPIVATSIPGIEDFGDVVLIARDVTDFAQTIKDALENDSPAAVQRRLARAEENSWDARVREIWQLLAGK